jgi:CRP-like cAMP-binding protein
MVEIKVFQTSPDIEKFEAGDVLFHEGDRGDVMCGIVEGERELSVHGHVVETVGADGVLGEMALVDAAPRSATATARSAGGMVRVDKRKFMFLVHEHPTFALQGHGENGRAPSARRRTRVTRVPWSGNPCISE